MTSKTAAPADIRPPQKLDDRYGKIGISAVAAAVAFGCDSKNHAYAPVEARADAWLIDRDAA